MDSVIERIQKGNFWQFHGGIHPPEQKFLTSTKPIVSAQIPDQLIIPIRQHIGQAGKLIVNVGDKVLKGQALTSAENPMSLPIHAPTSGTVSAIQSMAIPHPSGLSETCLILTPDGEDTWIKRYICPDFQNLSKETILEKIANAGIAGMGGAGFPTQVKVSTLAKIDYLIINAAECEPYITADDLLIQEHSPTILDGIKILDHVLAPKNILIGIEDNKPTAIDVLKKVTADIEHIKICVIPTKYPSGGEKQLIKILTGQEVPSGVLPSSLGIVMQNVATCFAIAEAVISDTPLLKRVVTVSGQALEKPQNIWALIGTPVGFLTQRCGYTNSQDKHLIMGGPMMGFSLPNDQIPVIKTTNCILAPSEIEIASPFSSTSSKEVECIRCGQCADACPAQLLPQELQWSAKAKDQPQLETLNLFDCIECGACAYVCPSQIPLVHYYRVAKAEIRQQKLLDIKAEKAKVRFEARKLRLEHEKIARAEKHKKAAEARKARMNAGTPAAKSEKSAVAAALARVKAKKAQSNSNDDNAKDATVTAVASQSVEQVDDSKSQVANAIARAKAKKLAQQNQAKVESIDTGQDIALAKPSTMKQIDTEKAHDNKAELSTAPKVNDKKSKVASAVAKAKAKAQAKKQSKHTVEPVKLETTEAQSDSNKTDSDNKLSSLSDNVDITQETDTSAIKVSETSDKKAKVAAAVAKAKAKAQAKKQSKHAAEPVKLETIEAHSDNNQTDSNKTDNDSKPSSLTDNVDIVQETDAPAIKVTETSNKKAKVASAVAKTKAKAQAKAQAKKQSKHAAEPVKLETIEAQSDNNKTDINKTESDSQLSHLSDNVDSSEQTKKAKNATTKSSDITTSKVANIKSKFAGVFAKAKAATKSKKPKVAVPTPVKQSATGDNLANTELNIESKSSLQLANVDTVQQTNVNSVNDKVDLAEKSKVALNEDKAESNNKAASLDTDRKAKIAAAIAKAKAKKLAQASHSATETDSTVKKEIDNGPSKKSATIDEQKKARIAATIAKAKAKKLAASSKNSSPSE